MPGTPASGKRTPAGRPDDRRYAPIKAPRRRDLVQRALLPGPLAASPTIGAAGTSTGLGSGSLLIKPNERGAYLYLNGRPTWGGSGFPGTVYYCTETMFSQGTTNPPWLVDFVIDTADPLGRFEVVYFGSGARWRLLQLVGGQWQYATLPTPAGVGVTASGSGSSFGAGAQAWVVTATGLPVESAVSVQVGVTLTAGQNGVLTWTQVTQATGYNVYRLNTTNGLLQLAASVSGSGTVTYTDTGAAIAGSAQTAPTVGSPTWKTSADSTQHWTMVTMGAPGVYRLRLETETTGRFCGIQVASALDTLRAPHRPSLVRLVAGDSFTQPTVQDNTASAGAYNGLVAGLGYLLGGDWIAAGEGASGWIVNGTGSPATNAQTRLADITGAGGKFTPDEVWWTLGLNDRGGQTAAAVQTAATACFQSVAAALPGVRQVAVAPFFGAGWDRFQTNLLAVRDAIKAAAAAVPGVMFIDPLSLPMESPNTTAPTATTITTAATAGNTQVITAASIPVGTYINIGNAMSTTQEVRRITGLTGTGPYTLQFGGAPPSGGGAGLANAHSIGEAVTPCGPSYQTGSGNMGAPGNDGTSSRYTGNDGTHPTALGSRNIAAVLAQLYAEALAG